MTREELKEILDSWENIPWAIREIGKHPAYFEALVDLALYGKEKNNWRAAYLVDKIHDDYPELLIPYIEKIIFQLKIEKNTSKKRHFLKLLSMNEIDEEYFGFLVDFCLDKLSSDKEPPAVRVHAMQVLYNISEKVPELKPELIAVIEHEMTYHSTAGILSRGSKLVKKLQKQTGQKC